ncbi:MAG: AAA family ATPase [Marinilabiliaceae bacterium]|nr:AAA family ATPase [Marinilabiliaceae bacterium]
MILELKIQNFLSFKDEVTFSFEATSDTSFEDYYVTEVAPGVKILKLCMVYGANASGKSNLIEAFQFINNLIDRVRKDKNEGTGFIPFLLCNDKNKVGKFELTFFVEAVKYVYALELDSDKIISEKLSYYPGTQPANLFTRTHNDETDSAEISFGSKVKITKAVKEVLNANVLKNVSFFVGYNQVNYTQPEIEAAFNWFDNQLLNTINPHIDLTRFTTEQLKKNNKMKSFAIDFMKQAQYNISDIKIETENEIIPEHILKVLDTSSMSQTEKEKLIKEGVERNHAEFEHSVEIEGKEEKHYLPEHLQSSGTMRYYGFAAPFYQAFENNAFLAVDEIDASMHAHLIRHLVRDFLMKSAEQSRFQLLFTTHNISLLNEKDLLRKDAIWFTEKQEDGSTDLFSMADFDIRKELSFYKAYNTGKFGAIPNVD